MGIIDFSPFFFVVAGLLSPGMRPMTSDLPSTGAPQATSTPQESLVLPGGRRWRLHSHDRQPYPGSHGHSCE